MVAGEEEYRRMFAFLAHHRYPFGFGKNEEEPEKKMLRALLFEKSPRNVFKNEHK